MPCLDSRRCIPIFGKTGSGKTRLARFLAKRETRIIYIEAKFDEFKALNFLELEALARYLDGRAGPGGFFRVSYSPDDDDTAEEWDKWDKIMRIVRLAGEYDETALVVDEADRIPNPKQLRSYKSIIIRGRHYGGKLFVPIALFPYLMPRELRSQATEVFCFAQHELNDLKYLRTFFGDKTEILPKLKKYDFLYWRDDGTIKRGHLAGSGSSERIEFYDELTTGEL